MGGSPRTGHGRKKLLDRFRDVRPRMGAKLLRGASDGRIGKGRHDATARLHPPRNRPMTMFLETADSCRSEWVRWSSAGSAAASSSDGRHQRPVERYSARVAGWSLATGA